MPNFEKTGSQRSRISGVEGKREVKRVAKEKYW